MELGFFQDMTTGKILGLHDLYDHNNCFDVDAMRDEDFPSIVFDGKTMREAAKFFCKAERTCAKMAPC